MDFSSCPFLWPAIKLNCGTDGQVDGWMVEWNTCSFTLIFCLLILELLLLIDIDCYYNYISNVNLIKTVVPWLCCIIQVGRKYEMQLLWFKLRHTNKVRPHADFGSETKNINRYIYVKLGTALCRSEETKSWFYSVGYSIQ